MSGTLDTVAILEDLAPNHEKAQNKRRSAKDQKSVDSNSPPAKRRGIPVPEQENENIDPLIQQEPFVEHLLEDSRPSSRQASPTYGSKAGDGYPYSPELAAIALDVSNILEKTEQLAKSVQMYSSAIDNIWKPLNENVKSIYDVLALRNNTDQCQLHSVLRELGQLAKDLKYLKEKPPTTRYPEQNNAMEQRMGTLENKLNLIQGSLNSVLSLLNGESSSQRMVMPQANIATHTRSYGQTAQYPLPGSAYAPEAAKYCILCAEKSNGTHVTAECTRYKHFADRLVRAIDRQICTKCLARYEDKDGTKVHYMCPKQSISCEPCVRSFGINASASHDSLFCPLAKPDKKHPKERQQHPKQGDKEQSMPIGYLSGAFNS